MSGAPAAAVRRRIVVVVLTLVFAAGWIADPASTLGAEPGAIDGVVRDATVGATPPTGLKVVLHLVDDQDRIERRETTTDAEGRFSFQDLSTAPALRYLPVVEYHGALYFTKPLSLAEQPRQAAEIVVYEATTSDQWLALERANILVQGFGQGRLDLMEMGAVANVGDRTYVGAPSSGSSQPTSLRFSLPSGAANVTPQLGLGQGELLPTADGFAVVSPVVPGRHQVAFSYSLSYGGDQLDLSRQLVYPTASFNLYLPDVGIRPESPLLKLQGPAELGGQRYLLYSATNLPRGTPLGLVLAGLPASGPTPAQQLGPIALGLGLAALAAGLLLVYRRRHSQPALVPVNGHVAVKEIERTRLLIELARLDEQYERGELAKEEYQLRREAGARELLALSQASGTFAGG
jgi:hypothetical protein